jgi:alkanesulfonate monooxygenase SsuD/methylene tetrahydromethanopterin reductase-like flavin-dependent oxidoreductase (luciferase family)
MAARVAMLAGAIAIDAVSTAAGVPRPSRGATVTQLLLGVNIPASTNSDPVELARAAETLGYDFVSASDHPCGADPTRETWTMLTWIAASTSRIRVATRVLGVPYRPPAIVAKMAETLDRLSGGRLILGLGGGYSDQEFRAFGLTTPTPREKVDGLEEAIQVIRGLWSQPQFSFAGRLYHTENADLEPKPAHRIPIWLGTFGDRALRVTGRHADGWIPSLGYVPDDQLLAMHGKVLAARGDTARGDTARADTGQDFTCALNLTAHVGGRPDPARPELVAGSADQVADRLHGFIKAGFTAFNVNPAAPEQMERIATDVFPLLRDQ